jgi:hypothetical protein
MATATLEVCPVVGTSNTMLPPSHPSIDLDKDGLVCPVTKATTTHHHNLHKHPGISGSDTKMDAESCPALQKIISRPEQKAMDEAICPVVGTVSSVLPPEHPTLANKSDSDVCPVTNAKLGDHRDKITQHPSVADAPKGAVCPVVGKAAK